MKFTTQDYNVPGFYDDAQQSPTTLNLTGGTPMVAVVGQIEGTLTTTDLITLTGTTATALSGENVAGLVTVTDSLGTTPYDLTTDYTTSVADGVTSIARTIAGDITDGATVRVTYNYVPVDLFTPKNFTSGDEAEAAYGTAYNSSNVLVNPLVRAAQIFEACGVTEFVLMPVKNDPTLSDWTAALTTLSPIDVDMVVPLYGAADLQAGISSNVSTTLQTNNRRRFILGMSKGTTAAALRTAAQGLKNRRISIVDCPVVGLYNPGLDTYEDVDGYWAAVAVAGVKGAVPPQRQIVNVQLPSDLSIPSTGLVADIPTIKANAKSGLLPIRSQGKSLQVVDGLTTDPSTASTFDLAVTFSEDVMVMAAQTVVDTKLVNLEINDATPLVIKGEFSSMLDSFASARGGSGLLYDYKDLKVRSNPTIQQRFDVKMSYKPTWSTKWIVFSYYVDLSPVLLEA